MSSNAANVFPALCAVLQAFAARRTPVLGDFLITRQWVYGKALGNAAAMRRN